MEGRLVLFSQNGGVGVLVLIVPELLELELLFLCGLHLAQLHLEEFLPFLQLLLPGLQPSFLVLDLLGAVIFVDVVLTFLPRDFSLLDFEFVVETLHLDAELAFDFVSHLQLLVLEHSEHVLLELLLSALQFVLEQLFVLLLGQAQVFVLEGLPLLHQVLFECALELVQDLRVLVLQVGDQLLLLLRLHLLLDLSGHFLLDLVLVLVLDVRDDGVSDALLQFSREFVRQLQFLLLHCLPPDGGLLLLEFCAEFLLDVVQVAVEVQVVQGDLVLHLPLEFLDVLLALQVEVGVHFVDLFLQLQVLQLQLTAQLHLRLGLLFLADLGDLGRGQFLRGQEVEFVLVLLPQQVGNAVDLGHELGL